MNLSQKRRARYFTLANIVIALIGLLFVAISLISPPPNLDWQSIFLNLGSDLLVVSLIFFLGKIMLVDPQQDIEEHLALIEAKLSDKPSEFLTKDQRNSRMTFEQFVDKTQDLFLCGVVLKATARSHRSIYSKLLEKGARLRFSVLSPDSPGTQAIAEMWGVSIEHIANDIRATLAELKILQNIASTQPGTVEVRLLKHEPVFSFSLRDPKSQDGRLYGDMRLYGLEAGLRPAWELTPNDGIWFERFVESCEALWEDSIQWQNENTKERA